MKTKVDQCNLFGMCYLALDNYEVFDVEKATQLLVNMGVKSVRNWMHFESLLHNESTINITNYQKLKKIIKLQLDANIQVIGMNHHCLGLDDKSYVGKVHFEDIDYQKWLKKYGDSWYTIVSHFPEITYWEIDNELNNHDFMYLYKDKERKLTLEEMAIISVDMLYHASLGIKKANPHAITIMGGLVDTHPVIESDPWYVLGKGNTIPFLEKVYDIIDSNKYPTNNYDDFFDCMCWHPYYYHHKVDQHFFDENHKIYEVVKRREGKDKKVFITEFGWSEKHVSGEQIESFIETLYSEVKKHMPYVESLHYFRMLNNFDENEQKYGLFYDPKMHAKDVNYKTNKLSIGGPKPAAYVYQKVANGKGSLTLNEKNNV